MVVFDGHAHVSQPPSREMLDLFSLRSISFSTVLTLKTGVPSK